MPKYDYKFKLECIKNYEKDHSLPIIKGMKPNNVQRQVLQWRMLYKKMGDKGLDNTVIFNRFTVNDKVKAVKMVQSGMTYLEVALKFGMRTHSTVRRWHLDYLKDGVAGLQYRKGIKPVTSVETSEKMRKRLSKGEREELLSLRKRNEILEIENEYLKKLDALVSKREEEEAKAKKQK